MSEDFNYELGSKEEEAQKGGAPLEAEDYIVKVAKITLEKAPTFINSKPNWNKLTVAFNTICLPFKLKAGGRLQDLQKKDVEPLTRFIFRNINPFSTGFQKDGSPSFLRAFIAYMEKADIQKRIKPPNFILLDKNLDEVTDVNLRKKIIEELKNPDGDLELTSKGYQVIPDVRAYEGRYIACAVEVDHEKSTNKIVKFSKVPEAFVAPEASVEAEPMKKFEESYVKMVAKRKERMETRGASEVGPVGSEAVDENSEVVVEDVAF